MYKYRELLKYVNVIFVTALMFGLNYETLSLKIIKSYYLIINHNKKYYFKIIYILNVLILIFILY